MRNPLIVIIFFFLPFLGTAQPKTEDIAGSWKVNVEESIQLMDTNTKARYDGMPPEARERAHQSMEDRFFVFNADGVFEARWKSNSTFNRISYNILLVNMLQGMFSRHFKAKCMKSFQLTSICNETCTIFLNSYLGEQSSRCFKSICFVCQDNDERHTIRDII